MAIAGDPLPSEDFSERLKQRLKLPRPAGATSAMRESRESHERVTRESRESHERVTRARVAHARQPEPRENKANFVLPNPVRNEFEPF